MNPIADRRDAWDDLPNGQKCAVGAAGVAVVLTLGLFLSNMASVEDGWGLALILIMFGVAFALQGYAIRQILREWSTWTTGERIGWSIGAVVIPLVTGFLAPVALLIGVVALARSIWSGGEIGAAWRAFGPGGLSSPDTGLGSWWGDDAVRYGADGRATWVGDHPVHWSADHISWIGDEPVQYDADGRLGWVGDHRVQYGADGSPSWIGEDPVR